MDRITDNDAFLMARGAGSRIEIHAADAAKASWTQLDGTAPAGASTIRLAEATGWQVGDRIAIASTGYEMDEAEARTVTAVSADGRTLTLDAALENGHFGEVEIHDADGETRAVDMRAEVALLSRNVTIQGRAEAALDGHGGHTMVMDGAAMHVDGAELTRMGQAGELGRYPLHWHLLGDASGQYVTNSSIHETYNKGLTIHGTQNAWVEDVAIVGTVGHSYYFEDGSEYGNVLVGNLGMNTRATESVAAGPIGSDHTAVSTYWVTNPDNHLVGNHAAGSDVAGFWMLSQETVEGASAGLARYDGYVPNDQAPGLWADLSSHSNGADGIFVGGQFDEATGLRSDFDPHLHELFGVDGFTTYKNLDFGIWVRNADGEWSDVAIADSKKGARMWGSHEIEGGVIVGRSTNTEEYGFDSYHGWELYDMASVLKDVHFAGFDGALDAPIANHSGWGRNTNNAVSGVTFGEDVARPFATRTHTPFLDGLLDEDGALMGGLRDIDGSLTGTAGATITPGILDTRPGEYADILARAFPDIPAAGFNWTEGAEWIADGNYWLNPAGATIGRMTFFVGWEGQARADFTITRTDNGASLYYDRFTQGGNGNAQLNVDGGMEGEYVVTYPDGLPPDDIDLAIWDLPRGTEVTYRFEGLPAATRIWGADRLGSTAQVAAAEGSAWTRTAGGDIVVKLVADQFQERIYDATDGLPGAGEDLYHDYLGFYFDPGPDQVNTPDLPGSEAPDDLRAGFEAPALPDRAPSTSNTVDETGGLARWSQGATWDGTAPGAGDVVVIGAGQQIVLDADAEVEGILVSGPGAALIVEDAPGAEIGLVADWVLVQDGGLFQAGTEADPLDTDFTLTLAGDDPGHDLDVAALLDGTAPATVLADAAGIVGEAGTVSVKQQDPGQWHRVAFEAPIADAVVVMGPVGSNGPQAALTRVRDVTETGFEFQIDEWDHLDGWHKREEIGWVALSEGTHVLEGGQTVVAGEAQVGTAFGKVEFGTALDDAVVLSEVASENDAGAVATRTRTVDADGFEIALFEEEAADGVHADETVAWIAVEAGTSPGVEALRTGDVLDDGGRAVAFATDFDAAPVLIADIQTTDGRDPAALRYDALTGAGVRLRIQEEQSADLETWHKSEVAGLLALADGLILAG